MPSLMANKVVVMQNAIPTCTLPGEAGVEPGVREAFISPPSSAACCGGPGLTWETPALRPSPGILQDPPGVSWLRGEHRAGGAPQQVRLCADKSRAHSRAPSRFCRTHPSAPAGALPHAHTWALLCSALLHPLLGDEVFTLSSQPTCPGLPHKPRCKLEQTHLKISWLCP